MGNSVQTTEATSAVKVQVSVIIPTHNREEFLRSAITSVLNQTFQEFELIVVDDFSGDHTAEVVRSFTDTRVRFIQHKTKKGGAAARNTGIRNAHGKYIAFLDDDDGADSGSAFVFVDDDDEDKKITICHKPGTSGEKTVQVTQQAWEQAHSKHGDALGPCPGGASEFDRGGQGSQR